jgi:2-polyprenyl-3-methyl-5-hydroxy-6-metoxy-1,4-benzoquinol methylase
MPSCPLCHQTHSEPNGWITEDVAYQKCVICGFVFIPRPISFSTHELYNADYARLRGHDLIHSSIHRSKLQTAALYLNKISKYISKGSMLDIGCSTGANVAKALELGWKVSGMDINTAAISTAQSYIPRALFYQSLEDPGLTKEKFNLITLFDVIEHIEDLHIFIDQVNSLLASQGLLFILTPDAESFSAKYMKNQWPHLFSEHISLFSRKNLILFLEQHNFRVLETGFAWKYVSLEGIYRHAACHSEGRFSKTVKALLTPFKESSLIIPFNIGESYVIAEKT